MAEARSIHSFFLTAPNQHRPFCDLAGRTAQPCPSPALCALFPHPLQNRVPRGERAPVALCREPPEPAGETSPSALLPGFPIRSHLPTTVPIPSSTQNAPGFAFFGLFRVRFRIFCCFAGAKFTGLFLCILPHSGYKLKPSVMPCRREVSFFT